MKTLVLCVDRDDDLGEKANVTSPIVGRKDNLRAAIALGLADPEDSDTNSIFAAIKIFDSLVDDNEEAEIATICGYKIIGKKSDTILTEQFNALLRDVKPNEVILVSDSREDEFILPIISSRVHIRFIHRVIVKQAKDVESIFYTILQAFQNDKILKKIILPIAILLLIFGVLSALDLTYIALGVIALILGIYLLIRVLHLEEPLNALGQELLSSLERTRYVATLSIILALGSLLLGIAVGWYAAEHNSAKDWSKYFYYFTRYGGVFIIGAGIIYVIGTSLDLYIRGKRVPPSTGTMASLLLCAMFALYGILEVGGFLMDFKGDLDLKFLVIMGVMFGVFAVMAIVFYTYQTKIYPKTAKRSSWRR